MSRPPRARESVLDAFEQLLVDDGERAATMDATARAEGVSKGGLLYHFASKDALEHALLERLVTLVDAPPPDLDKNDPDEDKDGVPDAQETTGTVSSFGSAPAILVGSDSRDIAVGVGGTGVDA